MQLQRLAARVKRPRNGHVDAGRVLARRRVTLVVVRHRRANRVLPAPLVVVVLDKGVDDAPGRRVLANIRVVWSRHLAGRVGAHNVHEFEVVLVGADALVLRARRSLQVLVRDLRALQLVLPLHLGSAVALRHAVDLPRRPDERVLLHHLGHQRVGREAIVKDEHEDLEADVLARRVMHGDVHEAKHHGRLHCLHRVGRRSVGAVGVCLHLAVELLPLLGELLGVLLLGLRELRVVGRRDVALGHPNAQQAHERTRGHRARARHRFRLCRHVRYALGVRRLLPRTHKPHVNDARRSTLGSWREDVVAVLHPVTGQTRCEYGGLGHDSMSHDHGLPPRHLIKPLVQPARVRGGRRATVVGTAAVLPQEPRRGACGTPATPTLSPRVKIIVLLSVA